MDTKTSQQRFVTIGLIFVNIFVLVAVFSFPPMCLPEKYQYYSSVGTNKELLNPSFDHFIMAELQKGIDEIQMRLQDQSSWFQYKFLFVGGLLAAFLGIFPYAQIRTRTSGEKRDSGAQLQTALQSPLATIALAAVSSLSLMIDLHIRGNAIVVNQIGLWIASHVEPLYLGTNVFPPHSLVGWETFLRRGEAMHTDVVNSITFFWPIHILTVICFLLYLINPNQSRRSSVLAGSFMPYRHCVDWTLSATHFSAKNPSIGHTRGHLCCASLCRSGSDTRFDQLDFYHWEKKCGNGDGVRCLGFTKVLHTARAGVGSFTHWRR
jgi:hypothetical protein